MSEIKSDQPECPQSVPEEPAERREEAAAIIKEMIAEGIIDAEEAQLIQFSDAEVLCVPDKGHSDL